MKRILVTGGFGRVGSHLIPMLLADGYQVRVTSRSDRPDAPFRKEIEVVTGNIADPETVKKALKDVDVVCHLAALFPPLFFDEAQIIEANVMGTFQLLQEIKNRGGIEKLVFASTDATYATGPSLDPYDAPLEEDRELWPVNVYGITKVVNEESIKKYGRLFDIPYVILRFFWSMVPNEMVGLMFEAQNYMDSILEEDKKGLNPTDIVAPLLENGEPFYDHITDVRDIARGVYLALVKDEGVNETFNIAAPDRLDYSKEAPKVAKALGRPFRAVRCQGLYNYEADIKKAKTLLGYDPKYTMAQMLEEALK